MYRLNDQRQPQLGGNSIPIAIGIQHQCCRCRQLQCLPHQFGTLFVHGQRRCQHTTAGIGNTQQLQRTLQGAILAAPAVQGDKDTIRCQRLKPCQASFGGVVTNRIDTTTLQRRQHRSTTLERYLALGGASPIQHHDPAKTLLCHSITSLSINRLSASLRAMPPTSPAPWVNRISSSRNTPLNSSGNSVLCCTKIGSR